MSDTNPKFGNIAQCGPNSLDEQNDSTKIDLVGERNESCEVTHAKSAQIDPHVGQASAQGFIADIPSNIESKCASDKAEYVNDDCFLRQDNESKKSLHQSQDLEYSHQFATSKNEKSKISDLDWEQFSELLNMGQKEIDQNSFEAAQSKFQAAMHLMTQNLNSSPIESILCKEDAAGMIKLLSLSSLCQRKLGNFKQALDLQGMGLKLAHNCQLLDSLALICGDIGESYAASGEVWSQDAATFIKQWISSPSATAKIGVGGTQIPELAILLEDVKNAGNESLETEGMPDVFYGVISTADPSIVSRRLSGASTFSPKYHILETIQWIEHMSDFAKKAGDNSILVRSLGSLGALYQEMGQCSIAIRYFECVLRLAESLAEKHAISSACSGLGQAYATMASATGKNSRKSSAKLQTKAIEWYERAHGEYVSLKNQKLARRPLRKIAKIYSGQKNHHKAIEILRKALTSAAFFKDIPDELIIRGEIGLEYQNLAQHRSAVEHLESCLKLSEELQDSSSIGRASRWLGVSCSALGKHRTAINYLNVSLQVACNTLDPEAEFEACMELGNAYIKVGEHSTAAEYFERALEIADSDPQGIKSSERALGQAGNAHYKAGNFSKALEMFERHIKLQIIEVRIIPGILALYQCILRASSKSEVGDLTNSRR